MDVFRTDAHDNFAAHIGLIHKLGNLALRHNDLVVAKVRNNFVVFALEAHIEEVHLRRADEACDELVRREVVQVLGRIHLLHNAVLHDHDTGSHRHSFGLVMGNVDEGGLQALMQLGDFGTHLHAQLSVQVGQRFVEQEDLRLTDDSTAQSNTLTLAAGQSLRLTVQQVVNAQNAGSFFHAALDFVLGGLAQLQAERHVVEHGHVRIQRVVLEHHRDIAILRRHVVDQLIADIQLAFGNFLQTGDHTKSRRFTAAGRANQNKEFLVFDFQIKIGNRNNAAGILFVNVLQRQACHIQTSQILTHRRK